MSAVRSRGRMQRWIAGMVLAMGGLALANASLAQSPDALRAPASDAQPQTVVTLLDDDSAEAVQTPATSGGRIAIERSTPAATGNQPAEQPARTAPVRANQEPVRSAFRISAAPVRANEPTRVQDVRVSPNETSFALRAVIGLTALAVLPAMLVCLTAFLRIIIVLSMLRHAIGMPETPPNTALIGLALFLTLFTMAPVFQTVNTESLQPFMQGRITMEQAYTRASGPMREFMVRQTREQDLALMVELSKGKKPESMDDISNVQLIPAYMLSELRAAFQIGFVVFLPFLLIDLIVSSILMALGMMMMPPMTIALPLKILMFILVDGWSVLLKALVGSFH
ncbi:flagellar type III secretion system pore protein FliP [Cupriavidus sp. SW-Y-13]|uniref:flagellar type III secretion system pore protein FliP n=1 Tax=Cupriavidus sp. SW-Y-13 TaxID=2653854 RepID=UPI001EEDB760|nr:flagellar type III secretion system pore protein FliP [Cupriavidus sp. SW-Y-13]